MWIDIAFAAFAGLGFYWGYSRGIIRTVISALALFLGFAIAVRFAPEVTELLADAFDQPPTGAFPLLGFIVAFILVLIALRLVANVLERSLRAVRLNFVNQVAGGLVTALLATVMLGFFLWFGDSAALVTPEAKAASVTYPVLEELPDQTYAAIGRVKPVVDDLRARGEEALRR